MVNNIVRPPFIVSISYNTLPASFTMMKVYP